MLVKDAMVVELESICRRMVSLLPARDIQCFFLDFLLVLLSEKSSAALLCDYKPCTCDTIEEMHIAFETHPHDKQVCLDIQRASEVVRQQQRGQSFAFLQVLSKQAVVCVSTTSYDV
jgi:hypothetical protein